MSENFSKSDVVELMRTHLEKHIVACERRVRLPPPLGLAFVDLMDHELGDMVVRLSGYVWSQKIQNETVTLRVRTPATWWEHVKHRWFPRWAIRRWPVKEREITESHRFETIALLPGFRHEVPSRCGSYVLQTFVQRTS